MPSKLNVQTGSNFISIVPIRVVKSHSLPQTHFLNNGRISLEHQLFVSLRPWWAIVLVNRIGMIMNDSLRADMFLSKKN
jgi:hypothetical protein